MKKIVRLLLALPVLFLFLSFSPAPLPGQPEWKVVIIRHGEKPEIGDNLSCQGFQRALQLAGVLHQKFGSVQQVCVPTINTGKKTSTARMYQTILPFAIRHNVTVNSKYDVNETEKLAEWLKEQSGTSLVVWEHKEIAKLAKDLGTQVTEKWDEADFDTILILTKNKGTIVLSRDRENIHPSATCP
ncbi:MAG TPA: histidine phosphatase family protein [Flavisolibacter sp.]|jgi:hypothetical protein|nr:histidine phosphatase family protein [Flavisolibacter sp.]